MNHRPWQHPRPTKVFHTQVVRKTEQWHRLLAYTLGISVEHLEAMGRADDARRQHGKVAA